MSKMVSGTRILIVRNNTVIDITKMSYDSCISVKVQFVGFASDVSVTPLMQKADVDDSSNTTVGDNCT